jgi:hypothetical protein
MLGYDFFTYSTIRKYQAAFGSVFNQLQVQRSDANGVVQQVLRVPLMYARKEKTLARLLADPNADKPEALVMPIVSYEMVTMRYDAERKLNSARPYVVQSNTAAGIQKRILNPVPYELVFNVYVVTKYQHDAFQILEQIMPFFTPQLDLAIELVPELGITVDAPIVIAGEPTCDDSFDGDYKNRRSMIWTIPFTMKAQIFGPIRQIPVIKFANVNLYDSTLFDNIGDAVGNSSPIDRVTAQPGLDANGHGTTNLAITIPFQQIEAQDDWEYITYIYGTLNPLDGTGGETY